MCKLDKPLRVIELFAGYGSQALALKYLNIPFEHWFVCDFDKYAIQSYNDIHNTNYIPTDITKINASDLGIENTNTYDYLLTYSFPCTDLSNAGKQAGNSIVVNVLIAIFKNLFINKKYENTLF